MTSPSEPSAPQCPPSPGRAITKTSSEERDRLHMESVNNRPASLDLAAAAAARQQQRPPHFPPGAAPPSHTNPLIYLQNNNMAGHINPAMLNQVACEFVAQSNLKTYNITGDSNGATAVGCSKLDCPWPGPQARQVRYSNHLNLVLPSPSI